MRFLRVLFVIVLLWGIGWLALKMFQPNTPAPQKEPDIKFSEQVKIAPLEILARLNTGGTAQSLSCRNSNCRTAGIPASITNASQAVTDGVNWYYYNTVIPEPSKRASTKIVQETSDKHALMRFSSATQKTDTIIATTKLTSPRDMYLSPDGQKLVYYSDNIVNPEKHLTEIWMYDVASGGVRLLAEKLFVPDIRSKLRWNSSSTLVWFLADIGAQTNPNDELAVVRVKIQPPTITVAFESMDWTAMVQDFDRMRMDVTPDGKLLVLARPDNQGRADVEISDGGGTLVKGSVVFAQWLENSDLLYAVQDRDGFTFWRRENKSYRYVARRAGYLQAARSDLKGEYVVFVTSGGGAASKIYTLQIASGKVAEVAALPPSTSQIELSRVRQADSAAGEVAGITMLDDGQLAAFATAYLKEIVGHSQVQPLRLITTQDANTVFIDFKDGASENRWLVRINDAIHVEWDVLAKYQSVKSEWQKIENLDLQDPVMLKLYEWEADLNQWILKNQQAK